MLSLYLSMIDDEGNRDKFKYLHDKYRGLIYHIAFGVIKNRHVVEDIVQDVFLILVQKIDEVRMDNEYETKSFIVVITKNCAIQYLRKIQKISYIDDMQENEIRYKLKTPNKYEAIDTIYFQEVLDEMDKLDEKYSKPLKMQVLGYKIGEIAEYLNIEESTVKVRIHRARKMLAAKMEELNGK